MVVDAVQVAVGAPPGPNPRCDDRLGDGRDRRRDQLGLWLGHDRDMLGRRGQRHGRRSLVAPPARGGSPPW